MKDFNPQEFMKDLTAMVDQRLLQFETKLDKKISDLRIKGELIMFDPNEEISGLIKGNQQNKDAFMKDLYQIMKKHGVTKIMGEIYKKMEPPKHDHLTPN